MNVLTCFLIVLASCSFKKMPLENQILKGHEELYSEPEKTKIQSLNANEKLIVIASTNNVHGQIQGHSYSFSDDMSADPLSVSIGGKDVVGSYFNILKNHYKNTLLLDSGDIFSHADEFDKISRYYSDLGYDALTVGLRDFNLKVSPEIGSSTKLFQKFSKTSKTPLILSNLYEIKTARLVEWEGAKSHLIKEVDGVKVGIVGLIPDDIVGQIPLSSRVGLYVEDMLQSTLKQARLLRSLGADIIVVLTNQSIECGKRLAEEEKLPISKVNFEPRRENACDLTSKLGEYLKRLPPQLVDVVIGGRNKEKISNFVNGVLVMGTYSDGKSFNYAELVVDMETKKVVPEKTISHQPVFFCHEFFKETNDCYFEDQSVNHKQRIPASFLGTEIIKPNISLTTFIKKDKHFEISHALNTFNADIAYSPFGPGDSQLVVMAIEGRELIKFLDEDFNNNLQKNWVPSPFFFKDKELNLSIAGMDIDLTKMYRVIVDLETMQTNSRFLNQISNPNAEMLTGHSWASITSEDGVSIKYSGQKH